MDQAQFTAKRSQLEAKVTEIRKQVDAIINDDAFDQAKCNERMAEIATVDAQIAALDKLGYDKSTEERAFENSPAVLRSKNPSRVEADNIHAHAAQNGYSVTRAAEMVTKDRELNGVEGEAHQELSKLQRCEGAFLMPYGDMRHLNKRTVDTSTGVGSVPTLWNSAQFVEYLRPHLIGTRLGWNYMDGVFAGMKFPRESSLPTAEAQTESGAATNSTPGLDNVTFLPHKVTANITYSRQWAYSSIVAADQFVQNSGAKQIGRDIEKFAINGTGQSNQVTGLLNMAGTKTEILATNLLAYSNVLSMHKKLEESNADVGNKTWLTSPAGKAKGRATTKVASSTFPIYVVDDQDKIGNDEVVSSTQIATNLTYTGASNLTALIYGNWDYFFCAFFGQGLSVVVDPYTSRAGDITMTFLMDFDIQVTQPTAFIIAPNLNYA